MNSIVVVSASILRRLAPPFVYFFIRLLWRLYVKTAGFLLKATRRIGRLLAFPLRKLGAFSAPRKVSETSKCRESLGPFCQGNGIDIGFGGDPIVPHAICMDLPNSYAKYQANPQHLHGDARDLSWFQSESMDFVYSSHVLEDFPDTKAVFAEWFRVLRPGGRMILFLPDEQVYRAHCYANNKPPNKHHVHDFFGEGYMKDIIKDFPDARIIHYKFPVGIYSFEMVIEKQASHPDGGND